MDEGQRFQDVNRLLVRTGPLANNGNYGSIFPEHVPFEPSADILPFLRTAAQILVVGAGGLGCELLKDLALLGFGQIEVIDMDTIDVSNLNRQFLFRSKDVGRSKSQVAAEFVMRRVQGVKVTAHFCKIQDMDASFYRKFQIIVLGLDSIEARRWINSMVCSLVTYEAGPDGALTPDLSSVIPMIDGGTEGLKGHARVIFPRVSACFECTLDLFPPQVAVPLCTIAETPRNAAHCVLYAHLIQRDRDFPDSPRPDNDDPEYQQWVYLKAAERAAAFGISGVTLTQTQGVMKNIIPAIASTNAIISAMCAAEAFKIVTNCSAYLNNNAMYMGGEGLYTPTFCYERNPTCVACSTARVELAVSPGETLHALIERMVDDARLRFKAPSIRAEGGLRGDTLYMRGPLEAATRANLELPMRELVRDGASLIVTDPALPVNTTVIVRFSS
ncbi:hypothetical protein KFE25_004806 [Diacronema lutheri]|uniref:NEDD8-activating enzyme E1 catalytic subunit n=2 Tax=Diacronema lutheri TaxID=2081491 RepID=A0A8J6CB40_DIALT|nr:hypothetical protein KFE25_004806 [Diacronema lutheri]